MHFLRDIVYGTLKDAAYSIRYLPVGKVPAGTLMLSYPKSGRTWLRAIVSKYVELAHGIESGVDPEGIPLPVVSTSLDLPLPALRLEFNHSVHTLADRRRPAAILLRDPMDTLVSAYYYYWFSRPPSPLFTGTMKDFIRSRWGAWRLARFMNSAARYAEGRTNLLWLGYEALHEDPEAETRRLLAFLRLPVDGAALSEAVAFSRFEKMQAREIKSAGAGGSGINSMKVRKGRIGGYSEEMSPEDVAYARAFLLENVNREMLERLSFR